MSCGKRLVLFRDFEARGLLYRSKDVEAEMLTLDATL